MVENQQNLRVVTLNTWKGDGLYEWRVQLMARELYSLMPDIVCLQECIRTAEGQIDTAAYLADFLDMQMVYAPARWKNRTIGQQDYDSHSGLAILTPGEIDRSWTDTLPSSSDDPDRLALTAQLFAGQQKVTITNLHLTHIPESNQLRMEQFISAVNSISGSAGSSFWLCCGDFNTCIDEAVLAGLEEITQHDILDCFIAGGGKRSAATLVGKPEETTNRIDYIFALQSNGEKSSVSCGNARIVLNEPDFDGCYPSDHYGVCVDIFFGQG